VLWWQYFSLGMATIAVLDYFLTLDDEVRDYIHQLIWS
jgi:hypothetical protein